MKNLVIYLFIICLSFSLKALPFEGTQFVISSPSPHSSIVARQIFKQGGNLADMAVAAALALCVTHPYYVSLGSGGFALVKMKSSVKALNFREVAPYKMNSDFFQKNGLSSQVGGASVAVPGFVAGMVELHKKHGKLSWSKVIEPAIYLAEKGFPVSGDWVSITKKSKKKFDPIGKRIFFKKGSTYKPNEIFKQTQMAKALKLLKYKKRQAFYGGPLGKDIISEVQKHKGLLSQEDLQKYQVKWLKPVSVFFRNYKVYSMPLPSSGGIILSRALKLIEKQQLYKKELYSSEELHLFAEIMARAFLPRSLMGDPKFSKMKPEEWISDKNIENINKSISLRKVYHHPQVKESEETTHISLMDKKGNAISMTLTLNGFYGSHIVTPKYGIVLNNQMDDFTTLANKANKFGLIQGKVNFIKGGKTPLSSMTPVIVEKNKQTRMVLGGAGGPTIITAVLQTLYRHLVSGLNIEQATQAPRIHHQFLPRHLFIEEKRFSPEVIVNLKLKGHRIRFKNYIAQIFVVARNKEGNLLGTHENRREGATGGL